GGFHKPLLAAFHVGDDDGGATRGAFGIEGSEETELHGVAFCSAYSVTLRCERSEPRRATAPPSRLLPTWVLKRSEIGQADFGWHPSRAASRPPQDDGKLIHF